MLSGACAAVGVASAGAACGSRTGLVVPEVTSEAVETPDATSGIDAAARGIGKLGGLDASVPVTVQHMDCAEAGITYIYVIGGDNNLYSFYPATGEFTFIGAINCPVSQGATPFSMAVDHNGVAYVVFVNEMDDVDPTGAMTIEHLADDGSLFKVSPKTAACEPTAYVPGQQGVFTFGMGFVANVNDAGVAGTSGETLYVSPDPSGLLDTIDLTTFKLHEIAPIGPSENIPVTGAELTGTGGGQLYGFFAPENQNNTPPSYIIQLNPKTATVASTVELPNVVEGDGWAFGYWGGDFYTFTAPNSAAGDTTSVVQRYRPSDGSITQVATAPEGVTIVGAGVSTCAPQQ